jgi:hypothetical protein
LARGETDAIEASSIRAAQVTNAPTAIRGPNFGVVSTHGTIVEHDLELIEPADTK